MKKFKKIIPTLLVVSFIMAISVGCGNTSTSKSYDFNVLGGNSR